MGPAAMLPAVIKPEPDFDDAEGTVTIRLDVKEGSVFHMGELEFRGLDNSLTAKLREPGRSAPAKFTMRPISANICPTAQKLLPAALDWEVASHVTANVRDKTVDVDLIYSVKAPK